MNETAARECILANGITRIMKWYSYHAPIHQINIAAFWDAIWTKGMRYLDVPTVISLSLWPHLPLQIIGIYSLSIVSDSIDDRDIDQEFENHIPSLLEIYNSSK